MATFKLTWADGTVEEVNQSDRDTVEGYIACRFGAAYDPEKCKVELVGGKVETVTYPDGTTATGTAPLPKTSPTKPKK